MLECIGSRDGLHLLERECAEWSAAGGKQDFLYLAAVFAHQTLEDSAVLAIHRQNRCMVLGGKFADDFACDHECLLIGKRDGLAGFDSFDGRP